ncbi:MAG: DUF7343 domain-containing protein [Candidatus Woesearchaeota archaeon]
MGYFPKTRIINIIIMIFSMILISTVLVQAATLSGSIYDLALQKESDAIVEINTVPKQLLVSKEGDYSFNIKPGNYTLHAYTSISQATEQISILDDGEYILDIILEDIPLEFPDTTLDDKDIQVSIFDPFDEQSKSYTWLIIGGILLILLSGLYLLYNAIRSSSEHKISRHKETVSLASEPEPVDEYENKILSMIKKEKRTTQKDIRKEIPLSEAKISLVLTDLEDKGKIRKIKKGRGNILIFVKD